MRRDFAIHQIDLVVGDAPGLAPHVIDRRRVNQIRESQLDAVRQRLAGRPMWRGEAAMKQMAQLTATAANHVEDLRVARLKAHHAVRPKPRRVLERTAEYEVAVPVDEKGTALVALEHDRVVADVIAVEKGEHDDIRGVAPYKVPEDFEFLRGAIAVAAEVDHLDLGEQALRLALAANRKRTLRLQIALRDRAERILEGDMLRLGEGIAKHRDAQRVGRLRHGIFGTAKAVAIRLDQGDALVGLPAVGAGLDFPSGVAVIGIELSRGEIEHANGNLRDDEGEQDSSDNEAEALRPRFHHRSTRQAYARRRGGAGLSRRAATCSKLGEVAIWRIKPL